MVFVKNKIYFYEEKMQLIQELKIFYNVLRKMLDEAKNKDYEEFSSSVDLALDTISAWCNPPTLEMKMKAPKMLKDIHKFWDAAMIKIVGSKKMTKAVKLALLRIIVVQVHKRFRKDNLEVFFTNKEYPHSLSSSANFLLHKIRESYRTRSPLHIFTKRQETFLHQLTEIMEKKKKRAEQQALKKIKIVSQTPKPIEQEEVVVKKVLDLPRYSSIPRNSIISSLRYSTTRTN